MSANKCASRAVWEDVRAERIRAHQKHGDTSMESSDPLDPTHRHLTDVHPMTTTEGTSDGTQD